MIIRILVFSLLIVIGVYPDAAYPCKCFHQMSRLLAQDPLSAPIAFVGEYRLKEDTDSFVEVAKYWTELHDKTVRVAEEDFCGFSKKESGMIFVVLSSVTPKKKAVV